MTADEKRPAQRGEKVEAPVVGDTTTRARNRTVMMTSEMTGYVRARLGGEFQQATPERSGGFVKGANDVEDGWHVPESDASSVTADELAAKDVADEGHQDSLDQEYVYLKEEPVEANQETQQETPYEAAHESPYEAAHEAPYAAPHESSREAQHESPPEAPPSRGALPAQILKPRSLPRDADSKEHSAPAESAPLQVRTSRQFKPMTQEEYLETFVEPPPQVEDEEAEMHDSITWTSESTLVGFLISYDNNPKGHYVELRTGRLMVTCEFEASGNCLVVQHPSVSPMHAIMRVGTSGTVQVLDQLSENGTKIRHAGSDEEEFLSGEKGTLSHGDVVLFGERAFYVCLIKPPVE